MITQFKIFEKHNTNFKNGDIVICVDDNAAIGLIYGEKYTVIDSSDFNTIRIISNNIDFGNWARRRFVKLEDFEQYKLELNVGKYNI